TRVKRFVRSGETVTAVVTDDAEVIRTEALDIAAAVPSGGLLGELGQRVPIYSGNGYSIDYSTAPFELRTPQTLDDARVAVTPLIGMLRLAGTMEFGSTDDSVNEIRVEAIRRAGREAFHAWRDGEGERTPWAGSRPMTPDGLPVIGRLDSVANAYVNSGH